MSIKRAIGRAAKGAVKRTVARKVTTAKSRVKKAVNSADKLGGRIRKSQNKQTLYMRNNGITFDKKKLGTGESPFIWGKLPPKKRRK